MSELTVGERAQVSILTEKELAALKDIFPMNSDLMGMVNAVEAALVDSDDFWEAATALGQRLVWEGKSPDPIDADLLDLFKQKCEGASFFLHLATC